MATRHEISTLIIVIAMALASFLGVKGFPKSEELEKMAVNQNVAEVLAPVASVPLATLSPRTKSEQCEIRGPLPDPDCSPGAVFPEATPEKICVPGYTKTVRNVSVATKKRLYREYGVSYPQPRGSYEADHLIPLALGGSNDIANLFPEAATPKPGFHEKDLVEYYLYRQMCDGHIDLARAQYQIATDWVKVYDALTPSELQWLRSAFSKF